MAVKPSNGTAGQHEGAVVARGEGRHERTRSHLVFFGIDRPDDREIRRTLGIAVEHEVAGALCDAAAHERAAPDLARQVAAPLGLLVADADGLHRDPESVREVAMRGHLRTRWEGPAVDVGDDAVGQHLVLADALTLVQQGLPTLAEAGCGREPGLPTLAVPSEHLVTYDNDELLSAQSRQNASQFSLGMDGAITA